MTVPSLAGLPAYDVRKNLTSKIIEESIECYHVIIQQLLSLPSSDFKVHIAENSAFIDFVISLMRESSVLRNASVKGDEIICFLRSEGFRLTHRILKDVKPAPPRLLEATFLEDLAMSYPASISCKDLLDCVWAQENLNENAFILESKTNLIRRLEGPNRESNLKLDVLLERIGHLIVACYPYGQFLMLGSDFLDSLNTSFENTPPPIRKRIVVILYWALKSLLEPQDPKISTLLDHLYTLKRNPKSDLLVKHLIIHTPILNELQERLSSAGNERARSLMQDLSKFKTKAHVPKKTGTNKGKGKIPHEHKSHDAHADKSSLIAQVQDFFPDHNPDSITKLLGLYHDNVEQVIAHVSETLDDITPLHAEEANTNANL